MSTDSSPFIFLEYDGEDFPSAYEKNQLGNYEPDVVFLTDEIGCEPDVDGVSVTGGDFDDFFEGLMDPKWLVFRYRNQEAVDIMMEAYGRDEEREIHTAAPPYMFEAEEAFLDPDLDWIESTRDVYDTVEPFGIEEVGFSTGGEPAEDAQELEVNLQRGTFYIVPGIDGVANVIYDWRRDEASVITYSDTIVFRQSGLKGDKEDHRTEEWRSVDYHVDRDGVENLERALQPEFRDVEVETFPETVIPPEIKEES